MSSTTFVAKFRDDNIHTNDDRIKKCDDIKQKLEKPTTPYKNLLEETVTTYLLKHNLDSRPFRIGSNADEIDKKNIELTKICEENNLIFQERSRKFAETTIFDHSW